MHTTKTPQWRSILAAGCLSSASASALGCLALLPGCFDPGAPIASGDDSDMDDEGEETSTTGNTNAVDESTSGGTDEGTSGAGDDTEGDETTGADDSDDSGDSGDSDDSGGEVVDCNGELGGEAYTDECGACVGGSTGRDECPTAQLVAVADARVVASSPGTNYGQQDTLSVHADSSRSYVKFDISGLPDEAVVRSARLVMTGFDSADLDSDLQIAIHEVPNDDWAEDEITWDTMPMVVEASAGDMIVNLGGVAQDTAVSFESDELSAFIQQASFVGDDHVSMALTSGAVESWYHSREAGPSSGPRLELAYELGTIVTLGADADTYVDNQAPDTNYGAEPSMTVEPEGFGAAVRRMFIRFDLGSLPPGAEVYGARLRAMSHSGWAYGGDGTVYTHVCDSNAWSEDGLTWNNQPSVGPDAVGAWWLWYNSTPVDLEGQATTRALAEAVTTALGTDGMISVRQHSPGYRTHYYSKESVDAANHPWLRVLYHDAR